MKFPVNEIEFFELVSNETRRDILRSIAREPKYLFQLSQELNKSQQSLQRHLDCLLEKKWITKETIEGERGPARKIYRIAKNLSVRITLSKHSFDFDAFEISIAEGEEETDLPQLIQVDTLRKDIPALLSKTIDDKFKDKDFNLNEQTDVIRKLDDILEQLGSIENFLLSRKLSITGVLNDRILVELEGDKHRQDREVAYTIFSTSEPITLDLIQKEVKTKRSAVLASLKRLRDRNLLPEHLKKNLESTLNAKSE